MKFRLKFINANSKMIKFIFKNEKNEYLALKKAAFFNNLNRKLFKEIRKIKDEL